MYTGLGIALQAYRLREGIADTMLAIAPEILCQADDVALSAIDKWDDGDFLGAKTDAEQALTMYSTLNIALQAYRLREETMELATRLAPQAFTQAETAAMAAVALWEAGDFTGARNSAERVLLLYLRAAATAERQSALAQRANLAAELQFIAANDVYNRANMAFQMGWSIDATHLFVQCLPMFREAGNIAMQRRLAAEAALQMADQRLAESDEIARYVESILQGGIQ